MLYLIITEGLGDVVFFKLDKFEKLGFGLYVDLLILILLLVIDGIEDWLEIILIFFFDKKLVFFDNFEGWFIIFVFLLWFLGKELIEFFLVCMLCNFLWVGVFWFVLVLCKLVEFLFFLLFFEVFFLDFVNVIGLNCLWFVDKFFFIGLCCLEL